MEILIIVAIVLSAIAGWLGPNYDYGGKKKPTVRKPKVRQSCYDVLGVDHKASRNEIMQSYRKLAKIHHPDSGGSSGDFDRITRAKDEAMRRTTYD